MPHPTSVKLALYFFATFAAFGFYLPYAPAWLEARGYVGPSMSLLAMLSPLMAIVTPPLFGMLADSLSLRGGLLRVACLGAALGLGVLSVAAGLLPELPFALTFFCFLVFAFFRSAMSGLADVLALEHARHYGRLRLWGSLGFLVSAWAGGRFVNPAHPFAVPACVAGGLGLSFFIARLLPRASGLPPQPAPREARRLLGRAAFRWLLAVSFVGAMSTSAYDLCLTLRLRSLGASGTYIGTAWAVGTAAEIALMAVMAPSIQRLGPARLLVLAHAGGAVRWALLSSITSLPVLMALQPLHAISFGLMWLSLVALVRANAGEGRLATAQGLFAASVAGGGALGMGIWGSLYASAGGSAVFTGAALLAGAAALLALNLHRSPALAPLA